MHTRLLLFILVIQCSFAKAQGNNGWAIGIGTDIQHFAQATPGFFSFDFNYSHKRSLFSIGYSLPLYSQEFVDEEDYITPDRKSTPSFNASYTFDFIQGKGFNDFSIGSTIGYKFGHWRSIDSLFSYDYQAGGTDGGILQVSGEDYQMRRESDQHHFYLGIQAEYPWKKIRLMASVGFGVVFRSSYLIEKKTTYYTEGADLDEYYYWDVLPFGYLSRSWYAKLGIIVPFSIFNRN